MFFPWCRTGSRSPLKVFAFDYLQLVSFKKCLEISKLWIFAEDSVRSSEDFSSPSKTQFIFLTVCFHHYFLFLWGFCWDQQSLKCVLNLFTRWSKTAKQMCLNWSYFLGTCSSWDSSLPLEHSSPTSGWIWVWWAWECFLSIYLEVT